MYNPLNQPSNLIPKFPESVSDNQQLMYMLASGTGGFVIANTNDLFAGLEKIGKEQNQYYLLGYTPPEAKEGACHTLKVKVERTGTSIRFRTGYCDAKPHDILAGNTVEKTLEAQVAAAPGRNTGGSLEAPFFYTQSNVARVNVAMEISTADMKFEKQKGKLQTTMNVLGIAYKPDGSVAARFSDAVKLTFENKKEMEQFKEQPMHYENQFDIGAGKYTLKVAFTAGGESFGKVETPLVIDNYESNQFTVSSLALSRETRRTADSGASLDVALIEDKTPLIVQGMQVIPSGSYRFKQAEHPAMYFEIYEPLLLTWKDPKPPAIGIEVRILDRKTGQQKEDTGMFRIEVPTRNGNPVIPVGARVPADKLTPGAYRIELVALDQSGKKFTRTADFDIE